ncbi:hypothetical protein HJG60_010705 [Phyllostomus discolor]|uniref:Uncharacterized protein n=1 Tax=Phyllostomus discolor TaxID=89673 RepID=A0A834EBI6_9CHIR|nr:hypothetical protein HJG60_010705 [Phyllostomus discolor]
MGPSLLGNTTLYHCLMVSGGSGPNLPRHPSGQYLVLQTQLKGIIMVMTAQPGIQALGNVSPSLTTAPVSRMSQGREFRRLQMACIQMACIQKACRRRADRSSFSVGGTVSSTRQPTGRCQMVSI